MISLQQVPPNGGKPKTPPFRPADWRWDEPLEYTKEGFLLPCRKTWLERMWERFRFW